MARDEIARWIGSIGIFYVLIPAYVVASDPLYAAALPFLPRLPLPAWTLALFIPAGVAGAALIVASIRDQVAHGRGHPFDLTGHERLSRPTQSLLTQGVYYWTRNPMGLGDILLYSAVAGVTRSFHSLLINIPLYAVLVCWNHRVHERPALLARFGPAFEAYEQSTSYLFPGPRTWRKFLRDRDTRP